MRRVPLAILTASLALLIGVERAHSQSSSQSSSSSKQGSAASPQDQSGRTGTSDTQRCSDLQQDNQRPSTGQRSDQDTGTPFDRGQDSRIDDRGQTMDRDRAGQGYDRQGIGSNFPGYRWGYGQPYGDWNRRYGGYQGMYGNFPSDMYGGYGWSGNQMNDSKARLLVIVPPDAQVWVDDQPTRSMGPQRLY